MILEVKVPMVGESITEVTMGEWKKSDGDYVKVDEPICVIESEKAAMDIVAEQAGRLHIEAETGDTLQIGDLIAKIDTEFQPEEDKAGESDTAKSDKGPPVSEKSVEQEKTFITSVAKKILEEAGIPPNKVKGTGPVGRITKADALQAVESEKEKKGKEKKEQRTDTEKKNKPEPAVAEPSKMEKERSESRKPMTTLRRTIAAHLLAAKNETAMLTTINEVDMTAILKLRTELKEEFLEKFDVKLGFMSFFGRAVCLALKEMPVVNSRVEGDDMIYPNYVDLSIAVSTPRGLVAPVIRDADRMSMGELEKHIQKMAVKARDGKLTIQDMSGGTFTITNGGVFGSLISTPIINAPQSAVLGMHVIQERPIALDGQVVIRPMMYISLSYDHRIIDGRESVLFVIHLKKLLENPHRMLLEL